MKSSTKKVCFDLFCLGVVWVHFAILLSIDYSAHAWREIIWMSSPWIVGMILFMVLPRFYQSVYLPWKIGVLRKELEVLHSEKDKIMNFNTLVEGKKRLMSYGKRLSETFNVCVHNEIWFRHSNPVPNRQHLIIQREDFEDGLGSDVRVTNGNATITIYCTSSKRPQAEQIAQYVVPAITYAGQQFDLPWSILINEENK